MWHSCLRIWHRHCGSSGHCCGACSISGLGTGMPHATDTAPKKERKKTGIHYTVGGVIQNAAGVNRRKTSHITPPQRHPRLCSGCLSAAGRGPHGPSGPSEAAVSDRCVLSGAHKVPLAQAALCHHTQTLVSGTHLNSGLRRRRPGGLEAIS